MQVNSLSKKQNTSLDSDCWNITYSLFFLSTIPNKLYLISFSAGDMDSRHMLEVWHLQELIIEMLRFTSPAKPHNTLLSIPQLPVDYLHNQHITHDDATKD